MTKLMGGFVELPRLTNGRAIAPGSGSDYAAGIRLDPVKFRVAIPAADPPDNAMPCT